uniref:Ig-like domain-containing protein n=1 Tax=Mola mola TaxID=94237 RepID=A0A3Q4AU83_MOLML
SDFIQMLNLLFIFSVPPVTPAQSADLKSFVHQESGFLSAHVGDNVTLRCFYDDDVQLLYWYKQTLGQKPRLISYFYKHAKNAALTDKFKNDPRFTTETKCGHNHLTIYDLRISDSATYCCVGSNFFHFEFHGFTSL